jgi:hypothetical protein
MRVSRQVRFPSESPRNRVSWSCSAPCRAARRGCATPPTSLTLTERLKSLERKLTNWRQHNSASDVRLAERYLKRLASLVVADEARAEQDPRRKKQLEEEGCQLWRQSHASTDR